MSGWRALLVASDPTLPTLVRPLLGSEGYDVESVASSAEAASRLPRLDPDVVVAGPKALALDGFDLCKAIREHPMSADVPIIVLAGPPLDRRRLSELARYPAVIVISTWDMRELPGRLRALRTHTPRHHPLHSNV